MDNSQSARQDNSFQPFFVNENKNGNGFEKSGSNNPNLGPNADTSKRNPQRIGNIATSSSERLPGASDIPAVSPETTGDFPENPNITPLGESIDPKKTSLPLESNESPAQSFQNPENEGIADSKNSQFSQPIGNEEPKIGESLNRPGVQAVEDLIGGFLRGDGSPGEFYAEIRGAEYNRNKDTEGPEGVEGLVPKVLNASYRRELGEKSQ